jgi:uncharacterized Zn finger protein
MATPPDGIPCKYCGKRLCNGAIDTWQPTLKCPHCGHVYREEAKEPINEEVEVLKNKIVMLEATVESQAKTINQMRSDAAWERDGMMGCQMGQ